MIILPDNNEAFRIVAFDPGSMNLGKALLEYNLDGSNVIVKKASTSVLKETDMAYSSLTEIHDSRTVRLMIMRDIVLNYLRENKPHAIIVESNYLGRFATSFAALVECVAVIRSALYEYDPFKPLYTVDPSTVKINTGMKKVKGTTKDDVKSALKARTDIDWEINIDDLDEHSVDAVAVAFYYQKQIL